MSRDQLLKEARVPLKPIGTLYQNILTSLYKLHRTRGTERVETAFILKNQIRTYIEKNPNSNRRRAAFLQLEKQINQALFPVAVADFAEVITPIAIEQPTLAKELYRDTFNTTRSYLLDNPVQGQHLDLTDLSLTHNLAIRLEKIIILVDNLASGNKKYHSLDTQDYLLLTDFFHQHDGKLDIKRVILTAFNEVHYLAWRKNVHHGLQLQDLSPQSGLSGQAALQQIQHWNEIQTEGAVALIDAGRNNHEPRVKIDTRLVLQGLYTDNKASHTSHQTPSHTATLALAWLDARSQGERTANQFLTGLEIHTALNEQRADSLLSQQKTQQTDHLRELFNQIKRTLGNQPFFTHQQIAAFNGETGHYLLKVGNHVLALTHQQQGEQYTSLLYAPNIGEMRVTGSDPNDNMRALYAAVQQYLAGKNSVWGSTTRAEHWGLTQVEGQYPVEVFKVNIDTTKERFPELAKLTKLLVDADTKPTQIDATSDTLWSSLHKKRTDWQQIRQMNHYANKIMKKYGYWSGISGIFQYSSLLTRNDLTKRQREDLIFERNITIASMGLDKVQDISLTGMNRYLARLQSANHVIRAGHTHLGIKLFGSRTGQISIHTATKLTKFAAPTLGLLSSSLDIVNAARLFSQLSSEINPDVRRDIIVNASLSTINAAVGISSGVALAAGGRVAVIATPASIAISMAITVVTQNYAAIRTLRTIEKYTRLTFSEKIDNYVQLFWGAGPRAEVQNRIQREQTRENARAYYDRIVDEYADKMVNTSTRGINTVYYSRGDFDLQKNNYRILFVYKIIGRKRNKLRILPLTNQDRIYPEDIPRVKTEYRNHHKYKYFKLHFSERSSQYHYFTPTNLHDVDDVVDASDPLGGLTASVRKTLAVPTSADQRQPDQQAGAMVQEGAILFYLGGGNDVAIGHPNKKNIFQVAAGSKDYTGGQLADVFYLTGAAAPTTASKLNGGKSHGNIIIADSKPSAGTGYNIDLKLGTVRYHEQEALIARIDNIEHAVGHAETNDILIGNQESNHLDGKGGDDKLYGNDGDDILVLARGFADGGNGIDTYHILQNPKTDLSVINIDESSSQETSRQEVSNIMLDYHVDHIKAVTFIKPDKRITGLNTKSRRYGIEILLQNDNGTETILRLQDVYRLADNDETQVEQVKQYLLSTRDGMQLFPEWPSVIKWNTEDNCWPFSPSFKAQYRVTYDHRKSSLDFFNTPTTNGFIHLKQQYMEQPGEVTVAGTRVVLPSFVQLMAEDTAFNDHLEGNKQNNQLYSRYGNDRLKGDAGTDIYHIYSNQISPNRATLRREITLDNQDTQPDPQLDLLVLHNLSIEQLNKIDRDGDDILLSRAIADPDNNVDMAIRIKNFMRDASYRHIALMDKSGGFYQLNVDQQEQPYLDKTQSDMQATEGNDIIRLSGAVVLTDNTFDALDGDDIIIDISERDRCLIGGAGNDILIATGAGKKTFIGGLGDDKLFGANGDDTYHFARGDGYDEIEDSGGTDTLLLSGAIWREEMLFQRNKDNLQIMIRWRNTYDAITIKNYFTSSENKIEKIRTEEEEITAAEIETLVQTMPLFPTDAPSSLQPTPTAAINGANLLTHPSSSSSAW
ncbi:membrane-targeted effector domain-containing toxin [Candidatus Fukatsuia symbiotica]|nr:membrane-targeted effector domain-containing toxin [Candidatus Fukatsuia symbiotica]